MADRTFYEMVLHLQLSDREIERVLAGQQPYGRSDLGEVAHFVANLRSMAGFVPPPPMSPSLLAQLHSVDDGRPHAPTDLRRARARRTAAERAHRRWRMVGAAAVVVMMGGAVYAGLNAPSAGPSSDPDTEIEDDPVEAPDSSDPKVSPPVTAPPPTEPTRPPVEATPPPVASAPAESQDELAPEEPAATSAATWEDWAGACAPEDWQCWWALFTSGGNGQPDGPPGRQP